MRRFLRLAAHYREIARMLGGLDRIDVFEIDHPVTQRKKLKRIRWAGLRRPAGRSRSQRKDRLRRSPLGKGSNDNGRRRLCPKIRVELHSSERLKGKLVGTTDAGLRLVHLRYETKIAKSGSPSGRRQSARRFERQDTETLIERKDIRTIRLRPRKTTRYKYRLLGLLGGIPPGFFGGYVGYRADWCKNVR